MNLFGSLFNNQKSTYKLSYFNIRFRGEFLRFIFAYAGQPYEDNRIEQANWPLLKPTFPFEQLPVLEVKNGNNVLILAQSLAIARYLGNEFNLNGRNATETALIDMYGSQVADLFNSLGMVRISNLTESTFNQTWGTNLRFFETRLERNRNGYLVGSRLSWADIYLSQITERLENRKNEVLNNFPRIRDLDQKIRSLSRIAEWIRNRPNSEI
nr:glutathione S-transferase GSTS6/7-5 [Brachionus angularis]